MQIQKQIRKIRILIVLFIIGLALSGVTAFPIETQLEIAVAHQNLLPDYLRAWVVEVYGAVKQQMLTTPLLVTVQIG